MKMKGQLQVRRVVAAAGDTVDITEDALIINGAVQQRINYLTLEYCKCFMDCTCLRGTFAAKAIVLQAAVNAEFCNL
ncbi:S26 family signal peptidase [Novisyntrophococcus fermenticellae]|uniref:S26 family signal peptidase n=1 Tax=Novisyntrophococcus fermenticellae TaxID=2068655 RepID=UPI001E3B252F|nr:S26 family signal peptidase [Novisyntrophococcus fermenticellae]